MRAIFILCVLLLTACPRASYGYSVLTHEALIDACWDSAIRPLLLEQYPAASEDDLRNARAYAYGGAVAPDLGYYPFGSKLFTDLVHYVRCGDFVTALFDESEDINEYAFTLGVLCHYNADKYGHPLAINRSVALTYPHVGEKYGDVVTYEQDPLAHVRVEFGFDVLQTARGNYAPDNYHDFIGFKVPGELMERAFFKTYGLHMRDLFKSLPRSITTFRWMVRSLVPAVTKTAWASRKNSIIKSHPGMTRRKFEYRMRRAVYDDFGRESESPGILPTALSLFIRIVPKVGPLKKYKIHIPGKEAEDLFIKSFDTVVMHYTHDLRRKPDSTSKFKNIDFDTGKESAPGEYALADKCFGILVLKLKEAQFKTVDNGLRKNILSFYAKANSQPKLMSADEWRRVNLAVAELKANPALAPTIE